MDIGNIKVAKKRTKEHKIVHWFIVDQSYVCIYNLTQTITGQHNITYTPKLYYIINFRSHTQVDELKELQAMTKV